MPFVILPTNSASGGYDITNSLRFNSGSDDALTKTFSSGNRKTFTISLWHKRSNLGGLQLFLATNSSNSDATALEFGIFSDSIVVSRWSFYNLNTTTALFRDVSAWYHIVLSVDTTQATDTNRMRLYVNGSEVTSFSATSYPTLNEDLPINLAQAHYIGKTVYGASNDRLLNGYLSDYYFIDGQQLTPSLFGETDTDTGIWKPKAFSGTYGTNGFYLQFKNSASLGTDSSGNGNTFTVNNLTSIDQTTDTPTNNFATLNSLIPHATPILYKDGNTIAFDSSGNFNTAFSSIGISQGKWYFEAKTSTNNGFVGICKSDGIFPAYTAGIYLGNASLGTNSWGYYADTGNYFHNGSATAYGDSWTNTDMIGCALDLDNNKLYFSKNGVFQNSGVPTSGATGTGAISITSGNYLFGVTKDNESSEMLCNFGYPAFTISSGNADANGFGNFEYAVPSGYYALCTKNLALYG